MIWNTIDFVCRETTLHLRRERLIAITTISTVAVLMLVLGSMLLFLVDVRVWADRIGDVLEVRAHFYRDHSREEAEARAAEVSEWPQVREARFIPKEEGWQWLRSWLASGDKLEDVDNPLGDCIQVYVTDPEFLREVARKLESFDGVKAVVPSSGDAGKKDSFAHKVVQFRRIITGSGIVIGALVVLAGVFIVHNTIRLALHSRWREIYIMQLIGAGRGVIAAPFLLEGVVHGGLGALLAGCVLIPAHMYLRTLSERSAPFLLLAPDSALLTFGSAVVLAGAFLGLTGSALSVRRYLRRKPEWHS
jgi:cell division transport system permease protein